MKLMSRMLIIIVILMLNYSCEKKPTVPVITTNPVTNISTTTAVTGGEINDDGGAAIISKGVCWNTSDNPTIDNNKLTENSTATDFTINLSSLSPNTLYYIRAFATNSAGTNYGESVSFKTLGDKPVSQANTVSNITTNSATLKGSVNPNLLLTNVSFEWGISNNYGNTVSVSGSPFIGSTSYEVTIDLTGLSPGTTYHFRIKATNDLGIAYSEDMQFKTLGQIPTTLVLAATNLQIRTATLNGSVNPNYLPSTVSFEWGTTTSYGNTIIPSESTISGNTSVNVIANLTGLDPGITYHFRIKASNELGTSYGNDMTFKTLGDLPAVILPNASGITLNSATLTSAVNPNYLPTTVAFEWGTSTSYDRTSTNQNIGNGNASVNVTEVLSGLVPATTYHYRIRATNELGTTYSEDLTCTTFALVDADNNYYHSINIGTQKWMKENLKTTKFNDNTDIPNVTDNTVWSNLTTPAYCLYNNEIMNKANYGIMYNWFVVETGKLCPLGWHIPDNSEWNTLINYLGGSDIAGGKLKEINNTNWQIPNTEATDESGFTGLPGGNRDLLGPFYNLEQRGYWWSMTPASSTNAWYIHLAYNTSQAILIDYGKRMGFSVRCIKD